MASLACPAIEYQQDTANHFGPALILSEVSLSPPLWHPICGKTSFVVPIFTQIWAAVSKAAGNGIGAGLVPLHLWGTANLFGAISDDDLEPCSNPNLHR